MNTKLAVLGAILAVHGLGGCVLPSRFAPAAAPVASTEHVDASVTGAPASEGRRAAAILEEAWTPLARALGIRPERVEVHVYADRAAYRAAGGAGEGLYLPDERRIATFAPVDEHVLRHELAHHFAVGLVGVLPDWLNEGIAEYLEDPRPRAARPPAAGAFPTGRFLYRPADYAHARDLVAWLVEAGEGTLAERLLALKRHAATPPAELDRARRAAEGQ